MDEPFCFMSKVSFLTLCAPRPSATPKQVLCLAICQQQQSKGPAKLLAIEHDLSSFSFFQRGSVQEAMNFFVQTVAERTARGTRATIQENSTYPLFHYQMDFACVICVIWIRRLD